MGFNNEKTVLITGCSSGIGRCLAHGLRARGWRVFATARKPADVTTLAAEGFESLPLDVTSPDSIAAAVDDVLRRTGGRLDALINNAGFGLPGAVEDLPRAGLRAQFETSAQCPRRTWRLSPVAQRLRREPHAAARDTVYREPPGHCLRKRVRLGRQRPRGNGRR